MHLYSSKLLSLILNNEIIINKIECDYYSVSYNELNRRLNYWKNRSFKLI